MTKGEKALWIAVGVAAVLAAGVTSAAALVTAGVRHGGFVRVAVVERGADPVSLDLLVPTPLVGAAASIARWAMPDQTRAEMRRELGEVGPLLRALAAELERCPDATLVEVDDGDDHVRIAKDGARLIVRVRSPEADVDVEVPMALVSHALRALEV
jgi:hypothetical protein